jgi:hypothetical protein
MWNNSYVNQYTSSLYMCSSHYLYWVINTNNDDKTGHCKAYPNIHKDYKKELVTGAPCMPFDSFSALTVDFAESSPHGVNMIYEVALDVWVNGVCEDGCSEFMIWNDNWHQYPAGTKLANVTVDGRLYTPWVRVMVPNPPVGGYICFVPVVPFTSGTVDLFAYFNYAIAQGWIPDTSTLGQICYGFEMVSTNHIPSTFLISNFQINDPLK